MQTMAIVTMGTLYDFAENRRYKRSLARTCIEFLFK